MARNPSRNSQATRHTRPTAIASSPATSDQRSGPPAAPINAPTPAAVSSAVVDSGPIDSCLDEPSTAYTASGARIAHRPAMGGSPAISA